MDSGLQEAEDLPSSSAKDADDSTLCAPPSTSPPPPLPPSIPPTPPSSSECSQTCEQSSLPSTLPPAAPSPASTPPTSSESVQTRERVPSPSTLPPTPPSLPPTPPTWSESAQIRSSPNALPPTPPSLPPTPPTWSESAQTRAQAASQSTLPPTQSSLPSTLPTASVQTRSRVPSPIMVPLLLAKQSSREEGKVNSFSGDQGDEEHESESPEPPDPIDQLLAEDKPPLPLPQPPSSCPIFCCFYAEFDNVVGPKVAFQSPRTFMDQDTGIAMEDIHQLLQDTFQRVQTENEMKKTGNTEQIGGSNREQLEDGVNETATGNVDDDSQELSIFDATSEYIITGNELAGKMINLSTHNMHILTRPTVIVDERYERNALLFCVGFVLRRAKDPRPFRPLLCKWADALRSMEVESQFLTDPTQRPKLQLMLDRLLVSLNSSQCECNLLLDSANALNLRAFRPPKPPALPVPDHAVPILVREDLLSLYDWDLAIKWVVLFIDGVNHARWIAIKSDVDMEMVRACLRVLKHHGVIELMDMFFYSNHYEFTQRATAMLAGKEPKLLEEAIDYTTRRHQRAASISPVGMIGDRADRNLDLAQASSARQSDRFFRPISEGVMSFPPASSLLASSLPRVGSKSREIPRSIASRRERKMMKLALAELYCSCHRNISFAELRISKVAPPVSSSTVPYKRESQGYSTGDVASGIPDSQARDYHQLRRYSTAESERSADFRGRKWSDWCDLDLKSKVPQRGIDWNEAFELLDHRRCMTFGVVHGLLRRVHNFPLAIEEKQGRIKSEATQTNNPTLVPMRERGMSFRSTVPDNGQKGSLTLASRIATMMDGSKCDDELVCEFERPLDELFELVEATGKRVLSIYSL